MNLFQFRLLLPGYNLHVGGDLALAHNFFDGAIELETAFVGADDVSNFEGFGSTLGLSGWHCVGLCQ